MGFTQNSIVEFSIHGKSLTGQNINNVVHYRQNNTDATGYDNDDLRDLTAAFYPVWRLLLPILSTDYQLSLIRARAIEMTIANPTPPPSTIFQIGEVYDFPVVPADPGTRIGEVAVTFEAIGVRKLTDRAGRHYRGSMRLGSLGQEDVIGNRLDTVTYLPLVRTTVANFFTQTLSINFGGSIWQPCVFARTAALRVPTPFTLLRDFTARVTGSLVNEFVTSQVSRKQSLTKTT